jgi:hypothetical protein
VQLSPVRQQIDNVLDKDATKGAKFRRVVAEGADSATMIEALVAAECATRSTSAGSRLVNT